MTHLEALKNRACEYLDSQNWNYDVDDNVIVFGMSINSKLNSCRVMIIISEREIQTYALAPVKASPENYADVVEFITRANFNLKLGKFEFDFGSGKVRFQTCLVCVDTVPGLKDVERAVDTSLLMLDHYGDGLIKNMMGYGNPEADIRAIENDDSTVS